MTTVINRSESTLDLPMGGPRLRPGVPTKVAPWRHIRNHSLVKAWLEVGAIELAGDVADVPPAALADARSRYAELFGADPDRRWGEKRILKAIDAKLSE